MDDDTDDSTKCTDTLSYNDPLLFTGILREVTNTNLNGIKKLIKRGHSVNINDNNGNTPLHIAVLLDQDHIVEFLLQQDEIVVDARNFAGMTPLFYAANGRSMKIVQMLIDHKADVNIPTNDTISALHMAVKYPELAHLLIRNGADLNAVDYCNNSPMHDAVLRGYLETVCMFLYYDCNAATIKNHRNLTPFMMSFLVRKQSIEIQDALIGYVDDFNSTTSNDNSLLCLALARTAHPKFIEALLENGAHVNFKECITLVLDTMEYHYLLKRIWCRTTYTGTYDYIYDVMLIMSSDQLDMFINVILETDHVTPLVECLNNKNSLDALILNQNISYDLCFKFIAALCSYGYQPDINLYVSIASRYKDQKLLIKTLRHMTDTVIKFPCMFSLFIIMLDMSLTTKDYLGIRCNCHQCPHLSMYLNYFAYRPFKTVVAIQNDCFNEEIHKSPPLLLEFARNAARDHIIKTKKIQKCSQYYWYINKIWVSSRIKDILTFDFPIYHKR